MYLSQWPMMLSREGPRDDLRRRTLLLLLLLIKLSPWDFLVK
jgi:hypothetical protein